MFRKVLLSALLGLGLSLVLDTSFGSSGEAIIATNCNGTQVVRTMAGQMEVRHLEANLPGCVGTKVADVPPAQETHSGTIVASGSLEDMMDISEDADDATSFTPKFNPENGPVFDIRSTDISNYRVQQMTQKNIRYAQVTRSVKMRASASIQSRVNAYLMRNDAVIITGSESGWVQAQGSDVAVVDTRSNDVVAHTGGKARGYIAAKFLRKPNISDLVRIGQADQAYWSDIARVNVAHLVNVREHPWYGSKIKFVLSHNTPLYVVSTVDNWSEVISDDRKIHGFIRSDYISVEKYQRVDR